MAAVIDIDAAVREVGDVAEKIKNDATQEFPVAANFGDAVRQGDLYIQLIPPLTEPPVFFKKKLTLDWPVQLAPGNTKGSRHCVEESAGAEIYISDFADILEDVDNGLDFELSRTLTDRVRAHSCKMAGVSVDDFWKTDLAVTANSEITASLELSGPILVLKQNTTISHPEHGDWVLPPGTYRCIFQRTIDAGNKIRRVLD